MFNVHSPIFIRETLLPRSFACTFSRAGSGPTNLDRATSAFRVRFVRTGSFAGASCRLDREEIVFVH